MKTGNLQGKIGYANPPVDTRFKRGQSGNPKGRPIKTIRKLVEECKVHGFEAPSRSDVEEVYRLVLAMRRNEVFEWANDPEKPMLIRIVAQSILSSKSFEIMEKMLDRSVWKPVNKFEAVGNPRTEEPLASEKKDALESLLRYRYPERRSKL